MMLEIAQWVLWAVIAFLFGLLVAQVIGFGAGLDE